MDVFSLSRAFFDWSYENTDTVKPNHIAMYFFIIEHCNRLGWKEKFGLPMEMTKNAIGISNYRTYKKTFDDLVEWGFVKVYQESKNQYSATVIGLVKSTNATTKALSKAMQKHGQKQYQSIVGIDIPVNQLTNTNNTSAAVVDPNILEAVISPDEKPDTGTPVVATALGLKPEDPPVPDPAYCALDLPDISVKTNEQNAADLMTTANAKQWDEMMQKVGRKDADLFQYLLKEFNSNRTAQGCHTDTYREYTRHLLHWINLLIRKDQMAGYIAKYNESKNPTKKNAFSHYGF